MPPILNPQDFGDRVVQLGLVSRPDVTDCWTELGDPMASLDDLIRVMQRRGLVTSFQADQVKKGITAGFFYGGYKILYMLAAGSFARVYRAERPDTQQIVALKVLRNRWATDKKSVQAFYDEAHRVIPLEHPNIVRTFDIATEGNRPFIVMEFIEGGNLRDFMAIRHKLTPARALPLMIGMASGLDYAFRHNVTHRDIKLTNILISVLGLAKLVDFGLGQVKEGGDTKQAAQRGQRTVDYSALERTTGAPKGDPRSDIYFLGCVFYAMITGRQPLPEATGHDPLARMLKRSFSAIHPVRDVASDVPAPLAAVVDRMMELDPKKRYQQPEPIVKALQELWEAEQAKEPVVDSPETAAVEAAAVAATSPESPDPAVQEAPANGQPSVLFLEAQEAIVQVVRDRFKRLGYSIVVTTDPAEAQQRFASHPPDCLIVDAESTGKAGMLAYLAMTRAAAKAGRPPASILILAKNQAVWAEHVKPDDQHVVVFKPLKLKDVEDQLQRIIPVPSQP